MVMAKQHIVGRIVNPSYEGLIGYVALTFAGLVVLATAARALDNPAETRMRRDLTFLSSDQCEGRGVTTRGINLAADYIAGQFRQAGLKPAGPNGSYFQHFTMPANLLDAEPVLTLQAPDRRRLELQRGKQFDAIGITGSGEEHGGVVFAGYGITAGGKINYDDYQGIDVTGKVVVVLRDVPNLGSIGRPFGGLQRMMHSSLTSKMENARRHGAAAILFVNDRDTARQRDQLLRFEYLSVAPSPSKIPALHVARSVVNDMLQNATEHGLDELERQIDHDGKPRSKALSGWTAYVDVKAHRGRLPLKNVVGVLEGAGPLAGETVVIGAHYDHLGYGFISSLSNSKNPAIHHGADDNGSGTTALM